MHQTAEAWRGISFLVKVDDDDNGRHLYRAFPKHFIMKGEGTDLHHHQCVGSTWVKVKDKKNHPDFFPSLLRYITHSVLASVQWNSLTEARPESPHIACLLFPAEHKAKFPSQKQMAIPKGHELIKQKYKRNRECFSISSYETVKHALSLSPWAIVHTPRYCCSHNILWVLCWKIILSYSTVTLDRCLQCGHTAGIQIKTRLYSVNYSAHWTHITFARLELTFYRVVLTVLEIFIIIRYHKCGGLFV